MNTKEFILNQLKDGDEHHCEDISEKLAHIKIDEKAKGDKSHNYRSFTTRGYASAVSRAIESLEKNGEISVRQHYWIKIT